MDGDISENCDKGERVIMNKIKIGIYFFIITSILYATRFICGAIGGIGGTEWGKDEFARQLSYLPNGLMIATIIALILGIVFFVWEFLDSLQKNSSVYNNDMILMVIRWG